MKTTDLAKIPVLALAAAAAFLAVADARPPAPQPVRPAVPPATAARVGTNILSVAEAKLRAKTLLDDEIEFNHLSFAPENRAAAEAHYYKEAVERWITSRILSDEARRLGMGASKGEMNLQLVKMDKTLRAKRRTTLKEFAAKCPFGSETLMKDVENAVLAEKLLKREVADKIPVPDAAGASAGDAAKKAAAVRRAKFPAAFKAYYKTLEARADVERF